jgi:hypothetical protein
MTGYDLDSTKALPINITMHKFWSSQPVRNEESNLDSTKALPINITMHKFWSSQPVRNEESNSYFLSRFYSSN